MAARTGLGWLRWGRDVYKVYRRARRVYVGPRPWRCPALRAASTRWFVSIGSSPSDVREGDCDAPQGDGVAPDGRAETVSGRFYEQDAGDGTARPLLGVVEFGGGPGSEIKEGQRLMAVATDVRRARVKSKRIYPPESFVRQLQVPNTDIRPVWFAV